MDVPQEFIDQINRSPFDELYGFRVVEASDERTVGELEVQPRHTQIMGIVHGGVFAAMIEAACSIGASAWAHVNEVGVGAMGLSNHTDFLKSVREGHLRVEATRIQSGGTLQLWEATVTDADGIPVAHGKVRLMNVKPQR